MVRSAVRSTASIQLGNPLFYFVYARRKKVNALEIGEEVGFPIGVLSDEPIKVLNGSHSVLRKESSKLTGEKSELIFEKSF